MIPDAGTPSHDELQRAHDYHEETRGEGGRYLVLRCDQCDYERSAGTTGRAPDCRVRKVPSCYRDLAKRLGYVEPTLAERIEKRAQRADGRDRTLTEFVPMMPAQQ